MWDESTFSTVASYTSIHSESTNSCLLGFFIVVLFLGLQTIIDTSHNNLYLLSASKDGMVVEWTFFSNLYKIEERRRIYLPPAISYASLVFNNVNFCLYRPSNKGVCVFIV